MNITENTFSFDGYSIVNIKTGKLTPVDKDGNPIVKSENVNE